MSIAMIPTSTEPVDVTVEYAYRHYPHEFYRVTLDTPVDSDEDLEALMEHINEVHVGGVRFDYWVDDDQKIFQVVREFDPAEEN